MHRRNSLQRLSLGYKSAQLPKEQSLVGILPLGSQIIIIHVFGGQNG